MVSEIGASVHIGDDAGITWNDPESAIWRTDDLVLFHEPSTATKPLQYYASQERQRRSALLRAHHAVTHLLILGPAYVARGEMSIREPGANSAYSTRRRQQPALRFRCSATAMHLRQKFVRLEVTSDDRHRR